MFPYILLIGSVVLFTYKWGVAGFFGGLVVGYSAIVVIGLMVGLISGGMVPRKVRDETATDFINAHQGVVANAFENLTAYEVKEKVEYLLDQMFRKANSDNASMDVSLASSPDVFIPSAVSYSETQPTGELKHLCLLLVKYICVHPLWFRAMKTDHLLDELDVNKKIRELVSKTNVERDTLADTGENNNSEQKHAIGQKQVLEGQNIAKDCYENGLSKGNPVYLSQIEGLIQSNFSYMPNAVLNGFLDAMSNLVESGEVKVLNIEGGETVFVHKDHIEGSVM